MQIPDEKKAKTVSMTLTQSCNLSCRYCYEHFKTSNPMDFDIAYSIINNELNRKDDYELVVLDFFGGEPFLQFELIKNLVEKVRTEEWEHEYIFSCCTNGTLVHGEIQNWLIENSDCFVCVLSYDGTKEMQNINRSNSAGMIDLDFFLTQYGDEAVKMTVSPDTLSMLAEGVIFLQERGFEVSCNPAYGVDWSDKKNTQLLERELNKLTDYYIDNPELTPCSMLDMGIDTVAFGTDKIFRFCGCGIDMVSYDVDGKPYPCHLFMPLSAGMEKAAKASEIIFYDEEIPTELIEDKCKNCIIKSVCPTCYGSNYILFDDIYKHDDSYCILTKIIIKARSYFKGKQWELGQLKLSYEDEQMLLKSILIIQENLVTDN